MKCEVVKDLLALYADDVCSDQTKKDIEEHLKECKVCSKSLEDYKKEINTEVVSADNVEKIKPFKKISKKIRIITAITTVLALIITAFSVLIWVDKNSYNLDYSLFETYMLTKKQNKMLLKGDIEGFIKNVQTKEYYGGYFIDDSDRIRKDAKIELDNFYNKYLKDKNFKVKDMYVTYSGVGTGFDSTRAVQVEMETKDNKDITLLYVWVNKKCSISIYADKNYGKEFERDVNQKLNPLISELQLRFDYYEIIKNKSAKSPDANAYQFFARDFYSKGYTDDQKMQLANRMEAMCKNADVISMDMGGFNYDKENKQFLLNFTVTVKDYKTGKIAIMKQTLVSCYLYYIPKDDAKLIANDGISLETEKQLLELL